MENQVVSIDGHEDVPANDEDSLMKAVANQPVSVAIDAGSSDFQLYSEVSQNSHRQITSNLVWKPTSQKSKWKPNMFDFSSPNHQLNTLKLS